jgi:hypothetical protein
MLLAVVGAKLAEQLTVSAGGFDNSWTWGDVTWAISIAAVALAVGSASTALGVPRGIDENLIRRE